MNWKTRLGYAAGSLLGLIVGFILFAVIFVPDPCQYHEPKNRKPGPLVAFFFPQDPYMGHPGPGFLYCGLWLAIGAGAFHTVRKIRSK